MNPHAFLLSMFHTAVAAADPLRCVPPHLPPEPRGRTVVVGAGKAAAAMAQALESHWAGALEGLVVTRYGHGVPCRRIAVVEAGHPVPDAAGHGAARAILELVRGLTADDLVIGLMSGGASSLLALPADGISLEDKAQLNRQLLRSGASIADINCVRKHLSAIKGGRLAIAAQPAPVVSLIISDVPGDEVSVIASGPTVADASTRLQAIEVLERHRVTVPERVRVWLRSAASETPKPGDPRLAAVRNIVIATPRLALDAAAAYANARGMRTVLLGDAIEGEARDCATWHAVAAARCAEQGMPAAPPCVLMSGGETTVTVTGGGRGGRNAEFLLGLALALRSRQRVWAIACDTDGIDGTEDNAGALLSPDSLARAAALGLDPSALLADNDAYRFFDALDDLVITGPTRTNVNDFRAILIQGPIP